MPLLPGLEGKIGDFKYFYFLRGFQNLVGMFLEFKHLQGRKKTLQENSIFYFLQDFQNLVGMFLEFKHLQG